MISKPIQLWLPHVASELESVDDLQVALFIRGQTRAYSHWQGETTVWLHPGLEFDVQWTQGDHYLSKATGSEYIDRIDVFHIGTSGFPWHPAVALPASCKDIRRLLPRWIDWTGTASLRIYQRPKQISLEVPLMLDDQVTFIEDQIQFEQMTAPTPGRRHFRPSWFRWPRQSEKLPDPVITSSRSLPTSTPSLSRERYRAFGAEVAKVDPVLRRITYVHRWPKPFSHLVSLTSGIYTQSAQSLTRHAVAPRDDDVRAALTLAQDLSRPYISEGLAPLAYVVMAELHGCAEKESLFRLESQYGLDARTAEEVFEHPRWAELMKREVPVTRVWGPIGLFWELAMAELRAGKTLKQCEHCGRIIKGTARRRFCKREENPPCWRARNATHQRQTRRGRRPLPGRARHF